jgi:hypothetical protein
MATTGTFDQGAPQFGLNDAVLAPWPSYTPVTDIMSVQLGTVAMEVVSAILTGDDRQTAVSSNAIGGTVQVRMGGLNPSILAVLLGKAVTSSASIRQLMITGGLKMPYVGICLKALSAEVGDTWIWIPKAKITSTFTIAQMEYGAFTIPEVTLQIVDDADWGAINIITHPTDVPITVLPPAGIAQLP